MLDIHRKTLVFEPEELIELERIIIDEDQEGEYHFLKKRIYQKLSSSQESYLKSHLDRCSSSVSSFSKIIGKD